MDFERPTIDELVIADEPESWADAGFSVDDDGTCRIGTVQLRLIGRAMGSGFVSWSLRSIPPTIDIDGIATAVSKRDPSPAAVHGCGAMSIDHLVWLTPDGERTAAAVTATTFLPVRRIRETTAQDQPIKQRFIRFGEVILEVVSSEPPGPGPVKFFGIAITVSDLDSLVGSYGPQLSEIRDAVQPGRRVATLRAKAFDISVPVLFITPA